MFSEEIHLAKLFGKETVRNTLKNEVDFSIIILKILYFIKYYIHIFEKYYLQGFGDFSQSFNIRLLHIAIYNDQKDITSYK